MDLRADLRTRAKPVLAATEIAETIIAEWVKDTWCAEREAITGSSGVGAGSSAIPTAPAPSPGVSSGDHAVQPFPSSPSANADRGLQ